MNLNDILNGERERVAFQLTVTDPATETYHNLLTSLEKLNWLLVPPFSTPNGAAAQAVVLEPTEAPVLVKVPEEKPEPEEKTAPAQVYDYNTVRAICAKANVPLRPIVTKYVPEGKEPKLSNVPEDKYAELVKEIEDAK